MRETIMQLETIIPSASVPTCFTFEKREYRAYFANIGPTEAQILIDHESRNRTKKPSNLTRIRTHMENGSFLSLNGQTVVITNEGFLGDAGHRMQSIVDSGVTLPFLVIEGVDARHLQWLDQNSMRSAADNIEIFSENESAIQNRKALDSAMTLIYKYAINGQARKRPWPSPAEKTEMILHDPLMNRAAELMPPGSSSYRNKPPLSVRVALLYLGLAAHKQEETLRFLTDVRDGEGLVRKQPALTYRDCLAWGLLSGSKRKIHSYDQFRFGICALNALLLDQNLGRCTVTKVLEHAVPKQICERLGISI